MEFNVKKCKVMHMGHNNMEQEYYMNGHKLEVTEEERDIGVLVTKNLKPASQCKKGGKDGPDCTLSNIQSLSLQGQKRLHSPLRPVCEIPPRICHPCLVPMA
jgi:hypothetical protein